MKTGYDAERVVSVSLQFPETAAYTADHKASLVRDFAVGRRHCLASAQPPARARRTTRAEDAPRYH